MNVFSFHMTTSLDHSGLVLKGAWCGGAKVTSPRPTMSRDVLAPTSSSAVR